MPAPTMNPDEVDIHRTWGQFVRPSAGSTPLGFRGSDMSGRSMAFIVLPPAPPPR
jgi:hypothetical protein